MFCKTKTKKIVIAVVRKGSSYKLSLVPVDRLLTINLKGQTQDHAVPLYNSKVESRVEKHSSRNMNMLNHIVVVSKTRTVKYL